MNQNKLLQNGDLPVPIPYVELEKISYILYVNLEDIVADFATSNDTLSNSIISYLELGVGFLNDMQGKPIQHDTVVLCRGVTSQDSFIDPVSFHKDDIICGARFVVKHVDSKKIYGLEVFINGEMPASQILQCIKNTQTDQFGLTCQDRLIFKLYECLCHEATHAAQGHVLPRHRRERDDFEYINTKYEQAALTQEVYICCTEHRRIYDMFFVNRPDAISAFLSAMCTAFNEFYDVIAPKNKKKLISQAAVWLSS